jgi:hypothetical protein
MNRSLLSFLSWHHLNFDVTFSAMNRKKPFAIILLKEDVSAIEHIYTSYLSLLWHDVYVFACWKMKMHAFSVPNQGGFW